MWFAYKLVSLNYWIQHSNKRMKSVHVVICLQISIFELLNTTNTFSWIMHFQLWFAYKLVSLNYWIQQTYRYQQMKAVVICLQISIFELLNTTTPGAWRKKQMLWFAYKLVSLNYWIQQERITEAYEARCDLLTN